MGFGSRPRDRRGRRIETHITHFKSTTLNLRARAPFYLTNSSISLNSLCLLKDGERCGRRGYVPSSPCESIPSPSTLPIASIIFARSLIDTHCTLHTQTNPISPPSPFQTPRRWFSSTSRTTISVTRTHHRPLLGLGLGLVLQLLLELDPPQLHPPPLLCHV